MDLRYFVVKRLKEHGIKIVDKSEFERDEKSPISKGGFASLYFAHRVKEPDIGLQVSIKVLVPRNAGMLAALSRNDWERCAERTWLYFQRECCILSRGEAHPNIQKCEGLVYNFMDGILPGVVFRDVAMGDFLTFAFKNSKVQNIEITKVQLMQQIASALKFLHERYILHRDVKATNILVDLQGGRLTALLSDFGSAKDFGDLFALENTTNRASLQWMSPEHSQDLDCVHNWDEGKADMWAFGCTMIEVLAVSMSVWPPKYTEDQILSALGKGERPERPSTFPSWEGVWDFVRNRCLLPDPQMRITSHKAVEELGNILSTVIPS